jgi:DNA ligase (NAD+)
LISRVTLHNFGMVKQHHLRAGDEIEIVRSGEVIPKFLRVTKKTNGDVEIPEACPVCASTIEIKDIRIFCSNTDCPGKKRESILNFVQKIGIEELSEKRVFELLEKKMIKNEADLLRLTFDDFLKLEKVKEKLALNLVSGINKAKNVTLPVFLSSLGIQGGALNKCQRVVNAGYDTIEKILDLTADKLVEIDGFAEKSASEFYNGIQDKKKLIQELQSLGVVIFSEEKEETELSGKKICITGSLSEKRSVIEDRLRKAGAVVVASVSKNTDILMTNEVDSTSSKFLNAKKFGITIIDEATLLGKINGQG